MWRQNIAPPNRVLNYNINNFNGGVNNYSVLTGINEASELINMTFYDQIVMEKRLGSRLNGATLHNEIIYHLDEFKPYTENPQMVRAGLTTIRFDNAGLPVGFTLSGSRGVDGENFMGKYFFVDGNSIRVYGKFPQATVSPYVVVIGTPNPSYTALTVVSTPTSYTPLDTTHVRGVTVYNYTAGTVHYEPCQNEKADPYLGFSVVPTGIRYIASLRGRLYCSGNDADDDNVFITHLGNPYYFPPSLPLQVPPNSDKITGLIVYDDAVIVGRQNDIHVIDGRTNNPNQGLEMFTISKLNTHTGFISNKSCNVAHNYLFYVGFDGNCYSLSSARADTKVLSTVIINKKLQFNATPFNLTQADVATACSLFHDGIWYISIKNHVFVYHYNVQAWTVFDNLYIHSFYNQNGTMLWGNKWFQTCKWGEDYLDSNNTSLKHPYTARWTSGIIDLGDAINFKHFKDLFVVAHSFPGYNSTIRVGWVLDHVPNIYTNTVTLSSARWGVARFGDVYAQNPVSASPPFTIGQRARTIKIQLVNSYTWKGNVANYSDLAGISNPQNDDLYYVTSESKYYRYEDGVWVLTDITELNQPMRIYQISGDYEMRGKR